MAISEQVKTRIRAQAQNRCGYCRSLQMYVLGILEIDHIIPKAVGGNDDEENLWLACSLCNNYKGTQTDALDAVTQTRVRLFNPRTQHWADHFNWNGGTLQGRTAIGRTTICVLRINEPLRIRHRLLLIELGVFPP